MFSRILLAVSLALVFSGAAAAQKEDVTLSVTIADARPMITITNNSEVPVTGFVVTVDITGRGRTETRIYYDSYVNWRRDTPIPAGSAKHMPLPHRAGVSRAELPIPELRAVVFSDGKTSGDPFWAGSLLRRRVIVLDRLREVVGMLQDMSRRKVGRPEGLALLHGRRQARAAENVGFPSEERLLEDSVFSTVIENLGGKLRVNGQLPDGFMASLHMAQILDKWREYVETSKASLQRYVSLPAEPLKRQFESTHLMWFSAPSSLQHNKTHRAPALRVASWSPPPQSCGVTDASQRIAGPDTCGNNVFSIKAIVGLTLYDIGILYSFGVCRGGFTDCWGDYVPQGRVEGDIDFFDTDPAPPNRVGFHWTAQSWYNEYFDCECSDPYPQGQSQIQFVILLPTPTFYADCE